MLDRAFRSSLTHRQPSVIILPHNVQQAPAPDLGQSHGEVVTAPRAVTPRDQDLDRAAEVIGEGEKVAILAGRGSRNAQDRVVELAARLGAGITTSLLGKPYVNEHHPLLAGTMGHLGTPASAHLLQECDTLLITGSNDPWTEFYPPPGQARAVQIDLDPRDVGGWRGEVVREVSARLPDTAQVAVDVGSAVYHYVRRRGAGPPVEHAGVDGLWGPLPERPTVVLAGDGPMEMLGINELITVADRWRGWSDPRFILVVLRNQDLSEVSWEQRESEPRFAPSRRVPGFDFAAYAEQLGLHGMRLHEDTVLDRVLDEAFTDADIPLLPPFPHGDALADSMRTGLNAEENRHGLDLLDRYVQIETQLRQAGGT